jgi:phenylpropionate dioxygenase-like ring-hydroxylating dioxygenase large terminal subunit
MTAFMDDRAVADRVLGHIRDRSTDRGAEVWREPVAHYRSAERLGREVEVLRRSPAPFCPSAALPEAGSYLAREASGTQLLAVRGDDGRVRVFRNACRHRGTPLAAGSGCAKSFVCPYHAWVYRLDGRLRHVPHEDGFPGLDKEQSGQQLIDATEGVVEVNWKVYLEGSIEGYHIRPAHKDTFYPYGFDNLNVVELCGRNSRVTYPFRRIEKLAGVAPEDRRVDGLLTYVYHLFPNALVTVLSRHTNLVVLEPLTVDRTKVFNYMLTNPGGGADAAQLAKRDAGFVGQTGAAEDLALVSAIQRSIGSGANEFFTFGHFEAAIAHFHRGLAAALDGDASAPAA